VAAADLDVEILQQPDRAVAARRPPRIAGQLDELEVVEDGQRPREVGEEDDARLQRRDEQGLAAVVVGSQLASQLPDAGGDLGGSEVDLADPLVRGQEASFRPNRWARRSTSRR
jgi:hypothetical protein